MITLLEINETLRKFCLDHTAKNIKTLEKINISYDIVDNKIITEYINSVNDKHSKMTEYFDDLRGNIFDSIYLNRHKTIWTKDLNYFYKLEFSDTFKKDEDGDIRWKVVTNKDKIKNILNTSYSSKGREEQYTEGLPSGTVVTGSLFPVNLSTEKFKLTWLNNTSLEDIQKQEIENKISLEMGSYIHKVLELWIKDDRPFIKKNIEDSIIQARTDAEVLKKVVNFNEKQMRYEQTARSVLGAFVRDYLYKFDIIESELFINTGKIQGSVDLLAMRRGQYYVIDFKTTRKIYKASGNRKFSSPNDMLDYHRQLSQYDEMMKELGIIPKHIKTNFNLAQFHLISDEYKLFKPSYNDCKKWQDEINLVLDWYWDNK